MEDQVTTDETVVEEAPVKVVKVTGKLVKVFEQSGETRQIAIVPIDTDDIRMTPKTLQIYFGLLKTHREQEDGSETDQKEVGRYGVEYPRIIDGVEEPLVVFGTNAAKTVELAIKNAGRGTVDDYELDADYEEDFFKQKVEADRVDPNDVWGNDTYKDQREALLDLAGEAEGKLETAASNTVLTQGDYMDLAKIIQKVYQIFQDMGIKNPRAALRSWAEGAKGASNHPALKKLGAGANSLTEAMRLAELTDAESEVTPASLMSGKALDRHKALALGLLTEEAGRACVTAKVTFPNEVNIGNAPDAQGAATMLRLIAERGYGIEAATDPAVMSLEQLVEAVDDAAAAKAAEFRVEYGKSVNTYDKVQYDYALKTYGRVWCSRGGHSLFAEAVGEVLRIAELEQKTGDDAVENTLTAINALFYKNLMMKKVLASATAHTNMLDTEKTNRNMFKELEEDAPTIAPKELKRMSERSALAFAGDEYKRIESRPDAIQIWNHLKSLVAQEGFKAPEQEKDAA